MKCNIIDCKLKVAKCKQKKEQEHFVLLQYITKVSMLFLCPFMQDYLSHYILHNGSFFHSCGNPIERVLIFSLLSMRNKRRLEKSPFAAIDCSIYARQHNGWYNLLGRKLPTTTHEEGKYSGIIGIVGKRLFQIRA